MALTNLNRFADRVFDGEEGRSSLSGEHDYNRELRVVEVRDEPAALHLQAVHLQVVGIHRDHTTFELPIKVMNVLAELPERSNREHSRDRRTDPFQVPGV